MEIWPRWCFDVSSDVFLNSILHSQSLFSLLYKTTASLPFSFPTLLRYTLWHCTHPLTIVKMSSSHCFTNPPILSSTCGEGTVQDFGGLQTYVTGPPHSKLAILFISDAFGTILSYLCFFLHYNTKSLDMGFDKFCGCMHPWKAILIANINIFSHLGLSDIIISIMNVESNLSLKRHELDYAYRGKL